MAYVSQPPSCNKSDAISICLQEVFFKMKSQNLPQYFLIHHSLLFSFLLLSYCQLDEECKALYEGDPTGCLYLLLF